MGLLAQESGGRGSSVWSCLCTGCASADAAATLITGSRWAGADPADAAVVVTYSFVQGSSHGFPKPSQGAGQFGATQTPFSEADQALVRNALKSIEAVCNLRFVEVNEASGQVGALRYAYSEAPNTMGHTGYAFYPSAAELGGDIWLGRAQAAPEWAHYRPHLILHETLHALGLQHPSAGAARPGALVDVMFSTVMSYSAMPGDQVGALSRFPAEPMPLDIVALQQLYGAASQRPGDTVYDVTDAQWRDGFHVIWDSGGNDRLDASRATAPVRLDLREGARSDIGVEIHAFGRFGSGGVTDIRHGVYKATLAIAHGAQIESAQGSGFNDLLCGNTLDNILNGGAGTDTVLYPGARASYDVTRTASGLGVRGAEGYDQLLNVERLAFADGILAFDLEGHAGTAATMIGALWGRSALANRAMVGEAITLLDAGTSAADLARLMVEQVTTQPQALVGQLFRNVVGRDATTSESSRFVEMLETGHCTPASLLLLAAGTSTNHAAIDLTGLAQSGLAFAVPG